MLDAECGQNNGNASVAEAGGEERVLQPFKISEDVSGCLSDQKP